MIFTSKIAGIPCKIKVVDYQPYLLPRIYGPHACQCDPPEPAVFDFLVLDSKGYEARWLEDKLLPGDPDRLMEEYQTELLGERYGYL